jgi:hypothetical protein
VQWLLEIGNTALIMAVGWGDQDVGERLLEAAADVNTQMRPTTRR